MTKNRTKQNLKLKMNFYCALIIMIIKLSWTTKEEEKKCKSIPRAHCTSFLFISLSIIYTYIHTNPYTCQCESKIKLHTHSYTHTQIYKHKHKHSHTHIYNNHIMLRKIQQSISLCDLLPFRYSIKIPNIQCNKHHHHPQYPTLFQQQNNTNNSFSIQLYCKRNHKGHSIQMPFRTSKQTKFWLHFVVQQCESILCAYFMNRVCACAYACVRVSFCRSMYALLLVRFLLFFFRCCYC